jgi:hypothetical protein
MVNQAEELEDYLFSSSDTEGGYWQLEGEVKDGASSGGSTY